MPWRVLEAATVAGLPYFVACAVVMKETGGGRNVYGHDRDAAGVPRPMCRPTGVLLDVTPENYAVYVGERDAFKDDPRVGRRAQGVGPVQLTFWAFQDRADQAGGCHVPYWNLLTGFRILAEYRAKGRTWHGVMRVWNGKEAYAAAMDVTLAQWRAVFPPT